MHLFALSVGVSRHWKVILQLTLNTVSGSHFGGSPLVYVVADVRAVTYIYQTMFAIGGEELWLTADWTVCM